MIAIRWSDPASADFLSIVKWLRSKNPGAASYVGRHILDTVEMLHTHPFAGRTGRSPDTRELVVTRYPYLIIYRVEVAETTEDPVGIAVLRVLHGAMLWPPEDR